MAEVLEKVVEKELDLEMVGIVVACTGGSYESVKEIHYGLVSGVGWRYGGGGKKYRGGGGGYYGGGNGR